MSHACPGVLVSRPFSVPDTVPHFYSLHITEKGNKNLIHRNYTHGLFVLEELKQYKISNYKCVSSCQTVMHCTYILKNIKVC